MYDSFINSKKYGNQTPIFETYIQKADASLNRELSILDINASNYGMYSSVISDLLNYNDDYYSSYVDSNFHIYDL